MAFRLFDEYESLSPNFSLNFSRNFSRNFSHILVTRKENSSLKFSIITKKSEIKIYYAILLKKIIPYISTSKAH